MKSALLAVLLTAGCGWPALAARPAGAASAHPPPVQAAIEAVALRADELRVDSLGLGAMRGVAGVVTGPAADLLQRNYVRGRRLQEHYETVVEARAVVHWSATPDEATAVVATAGRQRLLSSGVPSAWDGFTDQWQYTVRWEGGWRVWAALDLAPSQWWPA